MSFVKLFDHQMCLPTVILAREITNRRQTEWCFWGFVIL